MHHYNRYNTQRLFARMAYGHFTLQVLHEAVCEMIQSALAPGVLLVPRTAVRTEEFHLVLLRIAVHGRPPGAANAYSFCVVPVHGVNLLGSTSSIVKMHNRVAWVQFSVTHSL